MKDKKKSRKKNHEKKFSEGKNFQNFLEKKINFFREKIFFQNTLRERAMPWLNEKNAYKIWLSEIILQQTTVAQGTPYYEKFIKRYPTVKKLADATNDEVMKMWEGLGYYSRARNLHHTAKFIANELNGKFPNTYDEILKLKGIGTYTAAAIASFAYDLPYAVLDGNVFRVLARFFGIDVPIDTTEGKKIFIDLAYQVLDRGNPAGYNQAIMNFGATVCTPVAPDCKNCALATECIALQTQRTGELPIKLKKTTKKNLFFQYLIVQSDDCVFIRKRTARDIWRDLYEFSLIETENNIVDGSVEEILFIEATLKNYLRENFLLQKKSKIYKQVLTHRNVFATFWEIEVDTGFSFTESDFVKVPRHHLSTFAFPKVIDNYLKDKVLTLF